MAPRTRISVRLWNEVYDWLDAESRRLKQSLAHTLNEKLEEMRQQSGITAASGTSPQK